jgi:hypothetical protein
VKPGDRLVQQYLKSLKRELHDLPRARRNEIVDEIESHIAEARAGLHGDDESSVRTVLDRLGDPADIAADARARFGLPRRESGVLEVFALIGLLIGGLVIPVVGWFVGVALLWGSRAWTTREKLLGTLVVPGGLATSLFVLVISLSSSISGDCAQNISPVSGQPAATCGDETSLVRVVLGAGFLVVLLVAPVVTTAYLALRLRRPTPSSVAPLSP